MFGDSLSSSECIVLVEWLSEVIDVYSDKKHIIKQLLHTTNELGISNRYIIEKSLLSQKVICHLMSNMSNVQTEPLAY